MGLLAAASNLRHAVAALLMLGCGACFSTPPLHTARPLTTRTTQLAALLGEEVSARIPAGVRVVLVDDAGLDPFPVHMVSLGLAS